MLASVGHGTIPRIAAGCSQPLESAACATSGVSVVFCFLRPNQAHPSRALPDRLPDTPAVAGGSPAAAACNAVKHPSQNIVTDTPASADDSKLAMSPWRIESKCSRPPGTAKNLPPHFPWMQRVKLSMLTCSHVISNWQGKVDRTWQPIKPAQ